MASNNASALIFEKQDIPEEGLDINLCADPSCFVFDNCDLKLNDSAKIKGRLTLAGGLVYFRGDIAASIILTCARCLKDFNSYIQSVVRIDFLPKENAPKEEEIELEPSDLDTYYYENARINLLEPVRDQLVISIPIKPLCDINCAGLCPHCGQNLNEKKCGCSDDLGIDPRLEPLKKLKHLKEKK